MGQFQILFGNPSCFMGGKGNGKFVLYIAPVGMMVLGFGLKGNPHHYRKAFLEILEFQSGMQGLVFIFPSHQYFKVVVDLLFA